MTNQFCPGQDVAQQLDHARNEAAQIKAEINRLEDANGITSIKDDLKNKNKEIKNLEKQLIELHSESNEPPPPDGD